MSTVKTVTLKASQFRNLVSPVIPLASLGHDIPLLAAVLIEGHGHYLTATATDRYRMGVQRIKTGEDVTGFTALVSTRSLRSILSIFKTTRSFNPVLSIAIKDDTLAIEATGALDMDGFVSGSMAWPLVTGEYPKTRSIIATAQAQATEGDFLFNPALMADFKAAQHQGDPMLMRGTAGKAIFVQVGDDFVGCIMPVAAERGPEFDADWSAHFAPVVKVEAAA